MRLIVVSLNHGRNLAPIQIARSRTGQRVSRITWNIRSHSGSKFFTLHSSLFTYKVKPIKTDKKWQKLSIMPRRIQEPTGLHRSRQVQPPVLRRGLTHRQLPLLLARRTSPRVATIKVATRAAVRLAGNWRDDRRLMEDVRCKRADGCRLSSFLNTNFASKREQCQTCLSIDEREQSQDRDSGIN